jgi:molecular chaperone IbpA
MTRRFKLPSLWNTTTFEKTVADINSLWIDVERAWEDLDRTFPVSVRSATFPPRDIVKTETGYTISLAVAGFKKNEIKIELNADMVLSVVGRKETNTSSENPQYLYKGIAYRQFENKWQLFSGDEIVKTTLEDGILTIIIKRPQTPPEASVKQIPIE